MKLLTKLLVPVDLEENTDQVVEPGAALAREFSLEIVLLHVVPADWDIPPQAQKAVERAAQRLREIQRRLRAQGLVADVAEAELGIPFDAIIQRAESHDVSVQVNQQTIGKLRNFHDENAENWHSQSIVFPGSFLKSGTNNIEITVPSGDLRLKDTICLFKQKA